MPLFSPLDMLQEQWNARRALARRLEASQVILCPTSHRFTDAALWQQKQMRNDVTAPRMRPTPTQISSGEVRPERRKGNPQRLRNKTTVFDRMNPFQVIQIAMADSFLDAIKTHSCLPGHPVDFLRRVGFVPFTTFTVRLPQLEALMRLTAWLVSPGGVCSSASSWSEHSPDLDPEPGAGILSKSRHIHRFPSIPVCPAVNVQFSTCRTKTRLGVLSRSGRTSQRTWVSKLGRAFARRTNSDGGEVISAANPEAPLRSKGWLAEWEANLGSRQAPESQEHSLPSLAVRDRPHAFANPGSEIKLGSYHFPICAQSFDWDVYSYVADQKLADWLPCFTGLAVVNAFESAAPSPKLNTSPTLHWHAKLDRERTPTRAFSGRRLARSGLMLHPCLGEGHPNLLQLMGQVPLSGSFNTAVGTTSPLALKVYTICQEQARFGSQWIRPTYCVWQQRRLIGVSGLNTEYSVLFCSTGGIPSPLFIPPRLRSRLSYL
ncbi:hypothetical protein ACJZ2D_005334 [Fusarium nematophilum]